MSTRSVTNLLALLYLINFQVQGSMPPNTSWATIPVGYYGANWNRSESNIQMLAKLKVVVLMQQDGICWVKCCPHHQQGGIGNCNSSLFNSSLYPGCNAQCDQLDSQCGVFAKIRHAAAAASASPPHCMLYMNAVYDWPFYLWDKAGIENLDVLDVNGVPHAETCDPGIYPSYFLDFGRKAGQDAFVGAIQRLVVSGRADGVWLDNYAEVPFRNCNDTHCEAIRNQWIKTNKPSIVTLNQSLVYQAGKDKVLTAVNKLINDAHGTLAAFTYPLKKPDPRGAKTAVVGKLTTPMQLHDDINQAKANGYKYYLVRLHRFRPPPAPGSHDPNQLKSLCSEHEVATFLLGAEPGAFLLCNGWADEFGYHLGAPKGPAVWAGQVLHREFKGGAKVTWVNGTTNATIVWPSER